MPKRRAVLVLGLTNTTSKLVSYSLLRASFNDNAVQGYIQVTDLRQRIETATTRLSTTADQGRVCRVRAHST